MIAFRTPAVKPIAHGLLESAQIFIGIKASGVTISPAGLYGVATYCLPVRVRSKLRSL
jgi:hypothetical protein